MRRFQSGFVKCFLFLLFQGTFGISTVTAQNYDLRVVNLNGLADTVVLGDYVDSLTNNFIVLVENEKSGPYTGFIRLYYSVNTSSKKFPLDSVFVVNMAPGGMVGFFPGMEFKTSNDFGTGTNVISVWPVGNGINVDPGSDTLKKAVYVKDSTGNSIREKYYKTIPKILLFPNPTKGKIQFVISGTKETRPRKYFLYDSLGRMIRSEAISSKIQNIDFDSASSPGIYFVAFEWKDKRRDVYKILYSP